MADSSNPDFSADRELSGSSFVHLSRCIVWGSIRNRGGGTSQQTLHVIG